eukprot:CAMPEP_0176344032 /NCGR_PEP_ID=MMETSP0126-20121128/4387_1 /TAXON_ID=141414 ORGANISM="Strombidinopsis acuminatum, Strain SPMC142" /NCGR_SAMPLE_ID=MMETSP0126 /ASSEMBLY_ACC=CAM_ASM_000229 /LENGTH=94 /DNA_ID=CAMNT_0017690273 /DNA_START=77 /DNA_END=361 /DNA_ORIENTATION=-
MYMGSSYNPNEDYYKCLGVTEKCAPAKIKKEYYKLAQKYHPDKQAGLEDGSKEKEKAEAKFKQVSSAYEVLSDEAMKMKYDRLRNEHKNGGPSK